MSRSVHIDRLDLDLRGIDPALAEAAVRLLGASLQREFGAAHRPTQGAMQPAADIDAGRITPPSQPQALANRLASRIVQSAQPSPRKD